MSSKKLWHRSCTVVFFILILTCCLHAEVRLKTEGSKLIFGNSYIERSFEKDSWQTISLKNVRTKNEYRFPDAEDVILEFSDINDIHQNPEPVKRISLRQFTYESKTVKSLGSGGKQLAFSGKYGDIVLFVCYELHPDWFYMKKRVKVVNTGDKKCFLLTIYLESLNNKFNGKYLTSMTDDFIEQNMMYYYRPVHRGKDCFNLMEYPGAMENLFDLKYFPGKFLTPGQSYVSYPAVIGMTDREQLEFELREYAYKELYWYPGAAPNTYASWFLHFNWDGTPDNIYPHLRKSADMGTDLFIVDARLDGYILNNNDTEQWLEYQLPQRSRFPNGLEGILEQTRIADLKVGYYLRVSQLVRGRPSWMINSPQLPKRFQKCPPLEAGNYIGTKFSSCFAHKPYEEYFRNYTLDLIKTYDADFFHFDWFSVFPCTQKNHNHLSNGWDAVDKQHEAFMGILTDMRKENPSIVLQTGGGCLSLHWMKWLSHSFFHDIWPGPIPDLSYTRSCGADCRERLHKYAKSGFCPMMLISDWTDVGGELTHNPFGWKDSFMNAIAMTPTLRLEAGLYSYGRRELAWMKKWLNWRSAHVQGYSNIRFLWGHPYERGTEGYSFIDDSKGYLYFVNNEYADHDISISMDESIGITDRQQKFEVKFLYPANAVLLNGNKEYFEYGDTIHIQLPFKAIRYFSVFPYHSRSTAKTVNDLTPKSNRWVVTTRDIASKSSSEFSQYNVELCLAGKELPEKTYQDGPIDNTIHLNIEMVNEQAADKVYLLLCGEDITNFEKMPENPFEGLQVWVNGISIGGTVKSQKRRHPVRKDMPFFYSDVTNVIQNDINVVQWNLNNDSHKINKAILVREADESQD